MAQRMRFRMGLLGKKVGMTQAFDNAGNWQALAVVQVGPCVVLDINTPERNGYASIKIGFDEQKPQRTSRPAAGLFAKAGTTPLHVIKELRLSAEELGQFKVGQTLSVAEVFRAGDAVDVIGTSKGKGFQGVIKRHHFSGFRATHGTHEYFRHGGSIGCRLTPGRVFKGMKMPGQMGSRQVSVQNVRIQEVLADKNLLLLKGAVPGAPGGYVTIKHATKRPIISFELLTAAPAAPNTAPAEAKVEAGA